MTIDWTIVSTVITAVAALISLGALCTALGLLRREKDRDDARERAEREALARQVTAWFGPLRGVDAQGNPITEFRVFLENRAAYPIFAVEVRAYAKADTARDKPLALYKVNTTLALTDPGNGENPAAVPFGVVEPYGRYRWRLADTAHRDVSPFVDVSFTDAHARRWRMTKGGRLEQLTDR